MADQFINRQTPLFRLDPSVYEVQEGFIAPTAKVVQMKMVDYHPDHGFLTVFEDCKYPLKGFPNPHALLRQDALKKQIKLTLKTFSFWRILLPPNAFGKWVASFLFDFADISRCQLQEFWMKPEFYTKPVKEFFRTGTTLGDTPTIKWLVRAFCVTMENDVRYRHVAQDILCLLDKEALAKNPAKEVKRLLDIYVKREKVKNVTWMPWGAYILLKIRPEVRTLVKKLGKELDIEKIRPDTWDLYHMLLKDDYNYQGLNDERAIEKWKTL